LGYTTVFEGAFEINKELDDETYELLKGLSTTRRVKRDPAVLEKLGYGEAECFGVEGEFYVEYDQERQSQDCPSVVDDSEPPATQPGLWLQWIPTEDRRHIVWDKIGKFYNADTWILYLIENVLAPRGYVLNGVVNAQGEKEDDQWSLQVNDNKVMKHEAFCHTVSKPDFDKWEEERINKMIDSVGRENLPAMMLEWI
jgi:hypothetical protein